MNIIKAIPVHLSILCATFSTQAQSSFQNLNFEAANISGYVPGSMNVPVTAALPGWNAYLLSPTFGSNQQSQVWYDATSGGGPAIAVVDSNNVGFKPLQGAFSAVLFSGTQYSAGIDQTGRVPAGTESLVAEMAISTAPVVVTLGGQTINMVALQTFANYTIYGGDVSAFAGKTADLDFMELPSTGTPPSSLELDGIQFSTQPIPEPGALGLFGLGAVVAGWRIRRGRR